MILKFANPIHSILEDVAPALIYIYMINSSIFKINKERKREREYFSGAKILLLEIIFSYCLGKNVQESLISQINQKRRTMIKGTDWSKFGLDINQWWSFWLCLDVVMSFLRIYKKIQEFLNCSVENNNSHVKHNVSLHPLWLTSWNRKTEFYGLKKINWLGKKDLWLYVLCYDQLGLAY